MIVFYLKVQMIMNGHVIQRVRGVRTLTSYTCLIAVPPCLGRTPRALRTRQTQPMPIPNIILIPTSILELAKVETEAVRPCTVGRHGGSYAPIFSRWGRFVPCPCSSMLYCSSSFVLIHLRHAQSVCNSLVYLRRFCSLTFYRPTLLPTFNL